MAEFVRTPRVSVVMAVYDGERYLREALASVRDQTFTDYEFVIVDDGSSDNTPQVLQQWARGDSRVRLFRNASNQGLIQALNYGIDSSHGDLIARMDADDICQPSRLAEQVALLEAHPEVGLVGSGYDRLFDDGRTTRHYPPVDHAEIRWRLLFGNVWPHPAVMVRRSLVVPGENGYGDFLHAEDYELWARLSARTRCATVSKSLITIRTHESEGVSAQNSVAQNSMINRISARQIAALDWAECPEADVIRGMQQLATSRLPEPPAPMRESVAAFFEVFEVLTKELRPDRDALAILRRAWVRQLLAACASSGRLLDLWRSGLAGHIVRRDPGALLPRVSGRFT